MKDTTKRTILRWIHVVSGLSLLGYIYSPPAETVQYLPFFRYFYMPLVVLSGLLMWKGPWLRRLFTKKSN